MALGVPLRQTVVVYPPDSSDPNNPEPGAGPFPLKCRFQEGTSIVADINGRDVASSAQIMLDRFAPVGPAHEYEYTNEAGDTKRYRTINTARKRWLNGKAVLTVVYVK